MVRCPANQKRRTLGLSWNISWLGIDPSPNFRALVTGSTSLPARIKRLVTTWQHSKTESRPSAAKMERDLYRTRLHKFSCKPPGHDAARQRDNQRRHRARVKGRIADLEASLSSTQSRLDDALRRIESLTAELQRLQHAASPRPATRPTPVQTPAQPQPTPSPEPTTCCERDGSDEAERDSIAENMPPPFDASPQAGSLSTREPWSISPPPPANLPERSLLSYGLEDPDNDCALLPPPNIGESTIPCREAYSIIKNRSSPEFDLSTATEWLKPGFRRAVVPGTGCRVQTHMLFAFVDYITPI